MTGETLVTGMRPKPRTTVFVGERSTGTRVGAVAGAAFFGVVAAVVLDWVTLRCVTPTTLLHPQSQRRRSANGRRLATVAFITTTVRPGRTTRRPGARAVIRSSSGVPVCATIR